MYLNLISPYLRTDPKEYLTLYILYNYINTNIETVFSSITDTGGEIKINFDENGIVLYISVFSDLANKVIEKLFKIIYSSNFDESVYNQTFHMSVDLIEGKNTEMPYKKSSELFKKLIKYGVTDFQDMLEVIRNSTKNNTNITTISHENKTEEFNYPYFKNKINSVLSSFSLNSLFYGYLEKKELDIMTNKIVNYINLNNTRSAKNNSLNTSISDVNTFTMIDYLHAHKTIYQPVTFKITNNLNTEHNHIVENFFQVGPRDYKTSLVMNVIEIVWGNMFYYYLRTIKQLGYIVSANKQIIDNYMVKIFI